jgi:hypothetical protein
MVALPFVIANGAAGPYPGANFDANFNALNAAISAIGTNPGIPWAVAGGSSDAIAVTYSPAVAALTDGLTLQFRASAANATTTPTFSPNGLTAHTITKYGGSALVAKDIPAALAECLIVYNLANTRWELLDAATSTGFATVDVVPFVSSGTYTPSAGMLYCLVYAWGAGGGSGGTGVGGTGGTTSLGTLITAVGGGGGAVVGGTPSAGGAGGTGGTLGKVNGQAGGSGSGTNDAALAQAGYGGGSPGMAPNLPVLATSIGALSVAGTLPGQGAAGASNGAGAGATGGGGGGQFSYGVFTAATIGASQAVTIGAAGAAGTGGGAAGFKGYLYIVEFT